MLRGMDPAAAYVLHQHEWRDSGRIFELLTREQGRISVFAQGVRGPKSRLASVLRPFVPLRVTWAGRGEAPRLTGAEAEPGAAALPPLAPSRLMPAWYLSELVLRLTLRHDPQPEMFDHYAAALQSLRTEERVEATLRRFEKQLLDVLGYGIPREAPSQSADTLGLAQLPQDCLQRLADGTLDDARDLELVRPVLRRALQMCLDGSDLRTRSVARAMMDMERSRT
ncbi:MAG: DNA repair protein RecO [Steroidobacteraceae bacterium]